MNITLLIISIITFISYISFVWIKFGIQKSISQSYYVLEKFNLQFLFTLFIWSYSIPTLILGLELTSSILMFISAASICFVGAAAAYKEKLTNTVHMISAAIGITFCQLSIIFDFHMWYITLIFLLSSSIPLLLSKNKLWWIEIFAFISIIITFILKIF